MLGGYPAPAGTIPGLMIDAQGKLFHGATLAIRNDRAFYGPTFKARLEPVHGAWPAAWRV